MRTDIPGAYYTKTIDPPPDEQMPELRIDDVVRINHLAIPSRDVDGPAENPPQPRVGEVGVVVGTLGDDLYLVEHATDDGRALWVAEFHVGELDLVHHGD